MYYKDEALESLRGKWGWSVVLVLEYFAIYYIPSILIDIVVESAGYTGNASIGNLWFIPMTPVAWGVTVAFLQVVKRENVTNHILFEGFDQFGRIFWTKCMQGAYILLWTFCLIIPGIIKYYSYAMTDFILKDTDLSYEAAIDRSMELMDGHKGELFLLDLSFIGWSILICLACLFSIIYTESYILAIAIYVIGFLFLTPYWNATRAHFYEHLKEGFYSNENINE